MQAGTLTATTTAQALTTSTLCTQVIVQSDPANTTGNDVYIGTASAQPMHMLPGDTETVITPNVANVFAKTNAGSAVVNWLAS